MRLKVAAVLLFAAIIITGGAGTVAYHALAPDGQPGPKPPAAKVSRNAGARPAERRDRSGDPLPEGAVARLGTTRLRHGGPIGWFQFTPDGNTLVSQAGDGVRTWRATTGEQLHFFPGDGIRISGASLSPDGKLLATPGKSGVQVLEVATGRRFRALGTREVFQVCFSPDGKTLVAQPNHRSQVELWDAASGRCLHSWETGRFPCAHLTFADGGKIVIAAGSSVYTIPPRDDHQILYWGAASGKELRLIRTGTFNAHRIAVSPDGALLAAASVGSALGARESERRIRLWDVATGKEIRPLVITPKERFPGQSDSFTALAFAPDGRTLYAGGIDGTIIAWDAVTGKELRRIGKGLANPGALAVSPDHTTLAANIGSAIRLLDLRGGQDRLPAVGHDGPVNTAVVTPDGRLVVTAEAYCIHVWDMATGRELRRIEAPDRSWFTELCLLGDGRTVLTAEQDRNLKQRQMRVWNLATGKELRRLEGGASHLALAPDGKTIALSGSGNAVLVKDLATGKELRRLTSHGRGVYGTAFTPDGRSLVVWGGDNAIRLSDLGTGKEVRQFTFADERPVGQPLPAVPVGGGSVGTYFTAAVSPDGRLIACGSQTGFIALHELATGRLVRKLEALDDGILALAFAPDGKTLAWGGQHDGIVRVVDLLTGHERRRFSGHKGLITTLAFSTDGRKLVSGSWDTTAVVWDLYGGRPK
jgi:WD40 repeat protein